VVKVYEKESPQKILPIFDGVSLSPGINYSSRSLFSYAETLEVASLVLHDFTRLRDMMNGVHAELHASNQEIGNRATLRVQTSQRKERMNFIFYLEIRNTKET